MDRVKLIGGPLDGQQVEVPKKAPMMEVNLMEESPVDYIPKVVKLVYEYIGGDIYKYVGGGDG